MLVPLDWLSEYCDPRLGTEELAALLTLHGVKTERWFRYGVPEREHYVVGRVLEAVRHPNADRLRVCTVELGEEQPATIVCGAPNVAAGQTVAVARPGAKLPDGRTLGAAKLRGVLSEGMILATDEIALGGDHAGILVLADGPAPGTPLGEVLPLGTDVLELEITPNRPDCLAVYGVAREVHAMTGAVLAPAPWSEDPGSLEGEPAGATIVVECPELCPRFTARVFEDVTVAPSPLWLAARLLAAGMRPISNIVDITNYVMLLTGQPLHAFDLDRVAGASLTVRRARDGETIETLDGVERTLDGEMLVICDADGPTSIAGIMGGARSEVHDETTRILLEAATWIGANVQRSAVRLGLRSEASGRFEKGLSRLSPIEGQIVASALLVELCGARVLAGTIDVGGPGERPPVLALRPERVSALLGTEIPAARCREILGSLGFAVEGADPLHVGVPHWRGGDVTREVDLIEEVARIDGLARLPATLPPRRGAVGRLSHSQLLTRRLEDALAARGGCEIVGWSFTDPAALDRLRLAADDPMRAVVTVENPLSQAQSILRPTLLCSLLDAAARNVAHGARDLALFESGTVYRAAAAGSQADEHHSLGVLLSGDVAAPAWRGAPSVGDFYAAKGLLAAVLEVAGVEWELIAQRWPFLHPARCAAVASGGRQLGFIGELHPLVAAAWDLDRVAVWALDLGRLAALAPEISAFTPFGDYPPAREDLAVVVDDGVAAGEVIAAIRERGGAALAAVELFDVYRGPQVGEGKQSLALHLEFRAPDRTLTSEEIAPLREQIATALAERFEGCCVPSVIVVGASGYAGALAARLLWSHPQFDLLAVTAREDAGRTLRELYPFHRVPLELERFDLDRAAAADAAIVAYPHGSAAPTVAALLARELRVIDLSADFRLRDVATYEHWYVPHEHPELIERAVYGLTELYRAQIAQAALVACPGCFPTAAILALAPLAAAGLIADAVIDAKTGVSGMGKAPKDANHFVSVTENVRPYGVGAHRHMPEIDQELGRLGAPVPIAFTPHLLPIDQGELLSCYVTPTRAVEQAELDAIYRERYADEPFIDLVATVPGVRDVRETNVCAISAIADERTGKLFVFAAIDNLWKGTSSQALANLNLMFGFDEGLGLR